MYAINNISGINTNCHEGRLLMAALVKITSESQRGKEPDEVINQCNELAEKMYEDNPLPMDTAPYIKPSFGKAVESLINSYSKENDSNTPDFILSNYLLNCLNIFSYTTKRRDNWYGGKQSILDSEKEHKWEITEPDSVTNG